MLLFIFAFSLSISLFPSAELTDQLPKFNNPKVLAPLNETYYVGNTFPIRWQQFNNPTGFVNIDLINSDDPYIPGLPYTIARGIPTGADYYEWTLPAWLTSFGNYQVDIWGAVPARHEQASKDRVSFGLSPNFTIVNNIKEPVKKLTLESPLLPKQKITACRSVGIRWDYPRIDSVPAKIYVRLYSVGNAKPIQVIGIPVTSSMYISWKVPSQLKGSKFFLSLSSDYNPNLTPGFQSVNTINSELFEILSEDCTKEAAELAAKAAKEKAEREAQQSKLSSTAASTTATAADSTASSTPALGTTTTAVATATKPWNPVILNDDDPQHHAGGNDANAQTTPGSAAFVKPSGWIFGATCVVMALLIIF